MFGAEAIFPALVILLTCGVIAVSTLGSLILGLVLLFFNQRLGLMIVTPSAAYLALLLYFVTPILFPPPSSSPVSLGTVDFRQGGNLKMIFDGGLRPYRLQGLETDCCVFGKASLTVIVPHGSPFKFAVDRASIQVLDGNEIESIDLFGLNTSVPEAVALTKRICQAWNVPTTGLDDAIAHLGTRPDIGKGWGADFNQPKIRAHMTLKPLYYLYSVGAYVNVTFRLGDRYEGVKFLTAPIQPPPGYENVSMNPPPRVPADPGFERRLQILVGGTGVLILGLVGEGLYYFLRLRNKRGPASPG